MTESFIKKVLQEANLPRQTLTLVTRPLTASVYLAKVWPHLPPGPIVAPTPCTLYLILDNGHGYVAGVQDMETSLLFYSSKGYRSTDLIVESLLNAILPHLFQRKAIQRLVLSTTELAGRSFHFHSQIARAAGFRLVREEATTIHYALEATALKQRPYIDGVSIGITQQRMEEIKSELQTVAEKLFRLQVEMEMKNGVTYQSEILGDIIKEIRNYEVSLSSA